MKVRNILLAVVMLFTVQAVNASVIVIDDFSTGQGPLTVGPGGFAADSVQSSAGDILGGERDIILRNLSPDILSGESELKVSFGELNFSAGSRVNAEFEIQWDGIDGSTAINTSGLGGVDFSGFDMLSFVTSMVFSDADGFFEVTFWSNQQDNYVEDTIALSIPEVPEARDAFFLATEDALANVNFADIGAIRVRGNTLNPETEVRAVSYDLTIDQVTAQEVSAPATASMFGLALAMLAFRRSLTA